MINLQDKSQELNELYLLNSDSEILGNIGSFSQEEMNRSLHSDPWLKNLMMNYWEYVAGKTILETYPWDLCIPICDACNARCTFCTSWLEGKDQISIPQLEAFESVLRYGRKIGLAGHGEPLSHPLIIDILDRVESWVDSRAACYIITNGVFLESLIEKLVAAGVLSYAISLNAATPHTHEEVMGLKKGTFQNILDSIKKLVELRKAGKIYGVSISMVLTQQNIHEIEEFIKLGNNLDVNNIQIKTLAGVGGEIPGLNYHVLPPYLHQDFPSLKERAIKAITDSVVSVQSDPASWETPVLSVQMEEKIRLTPPVYISREEALRNKDVRKYWRGQEKFAVKSHGELNEFVNDFDGNNPFDRRPRYACKSPYHFLYINDFSFTMVPCCYLNSVPGYNKVMFDGSGEFWGAWNSPAMVELRRRLKEGPLFNMCTKCPGTF